MSHRDLRVRFLRVIRDIRFEPGAVFLWCRECAFLFCVRP